MISFIINVGMIHISLFISCNMTFVHNYPSLHIREFLLFLKNIVKHKCHRNVLKQKIYYNTYSSMVTIESTMLIFEILRNGIAVASKQAPTTPILLFLLLLYAWFPASHDIAFPGDG